MKYRIREIIVVVLLTGTGVDCFSQEELPDFLPDSTTTELLSNSRKIQYDNKNRTGVLFSDIQAVSYLQKIIRPENWKDPDDPLRRAMEQLVIRASYPPYDSTSTLLEHYHYDSLYVPWENFYRWREVRFRIPVIKPYQTEGEIDTAASGDNILSYGLTGDTDSVFIDPLSGLRDTVVFIAMDSLHRVMLPDKRFPFAYYEAPWQPDSIKAAVDLLLSIAGERDSTLIHFTGPGNYVTPIWINSRSNKMSRHWLKNEFSDSVTVWIGNLSEDTVSLYLESGISIRRPVRQNIYAEPVIEVNKIDRSRLMNVQEIDIRKQYWKYRTDASFMISQASLSNWVKGGESNISGSADITGYVNYENNPSKVISKNFIRMKLGFINSEEKGFRKSVDLLETNSKINHKAFGKFDFSGVFLFKTQLMKGYKYPNDSVPVSRFLNPAIITVGVGLDYKPGKNSSINFSPLSYKATFVPDTATIDQTKYGIAEDKRSLHEPGASLMISNEFNLFKTIKVTNRLQLFTNYIHNPLNIDVDWEMIMTASLNWFIDVRFNTHLIFDDDTKTVELDKEDNPVLRSDGTQKKTARVQFKEMVGFSIVFRF